jgi:hypothetical protein
MSVKLTWDNAGKGLLAIGALLFFLAWIYPLDIYENEADNLFYDEADDCDQTQMFHIASTFLILGAIFVDKKLKP